MVQGNDNACYNILCMLFPTDQDTAVKFFRTVSSHGKRPDPAAKASLHTTRVRSAVMTPLRKQREEKAAQSYFQHLARFVVKNFDSDTKTWYVDKNNNIYIFAKRATYYLHG